MNYATQHHIGNYKNLRRKKTTTIEPTATRICKVDGSDKGCKRNHKRQAQISTAQPTADGFLRNTFLPKLQRNNPIQACEKTLHTERDFYQSLSQLTSHYQIETIETFDYGYPYNIALAFSDLKKRLKSKIKTYDHLKIVQDDTKVYINSTERCSNPFQLYYIPVIPLFLMLKDKSKRKNAHLLLSVCSYLYHVADIPYYRQEDSYLYWEYNMLKDWLLEDEEPDGREDYENEIRSAERVGDRIEQKIFNLKNLEVFKNRVALFNVKNDFDTECLNIAKSVLALYEQYPDEKYYRNAEEIMTKEDEDEYDDEVITMDKYFSFYADSRGWLSENLLETINSEFNEYGKVQEPIVCKQFDGSHIEGKNLDFEERLFTLIEDLIYFLNDYK